MTPSRIPRTRARYIGRGMRLGSGTPARAASALARYAPGVLALSPYRKTAAIAAATLGTWYAAKRKKAFKKWAAKMRIGPQPGIPQAKRVETASASDGFLNTKVLHYAELTDIAHTTTNEISKRQRDICYISGFKFMAEFKNALQAGLPARPLYLNVAFVYDRESNKGTVIVNGDEFFRANTGNTRYKDFGGAMSAMERHCLPLNTDRFTIISHKRYILGNIKDSSGMNTNMARSWLSICRYIKLRKRITYTNDDKANSKIWLLIWCDMFGDNSADPIQVNALNYDYHVSAYFREVKS